VSTRAFLQFLDAETKSLRQAGLVRPELELPAPPGPTIEVGEREVLNFASSDYLGLAVHEATKRAAIEAVTKWGVGLAAARASVGTVTLHTELERAVAQLVGTEEALVYPSGHHADTGVFESLIGDRDYVFCDEMIRPSLADGIRLSRARAYSYRNCDLQHLEDRLKRSRAARFRIIATDGVFPITGRIAPLTEIYALASKYHAMVVVDDGQGIGVLGPTGQGAHGLAETKEGPDLVTGSFGNALGGGGGGFVAGKSTLIAWLRQKSRPHLGSTALDPGAAAAALKAIELLRTEPRHRNTLQENLRTFHDAMAKDAGLLVEVGHPAVSVLVRNAVLAQRLTDYVFREGAYVLGYCHPVVPENDARISLRITARHDKAQLERVAAIIGAGMKELGIQL
jgi:glycine C-acetyltransferase